MGSPAALVLLLAPLSALADGERVDFTREVRPILSDSCFACHGPDEEAREAELDLSHPEEATADRGGYAAVVPGDPEASELWLRISDPDDGMPPAKVKKRLSEEEKTILRRWIEQGASYEPHWAYVAPRRVEVPEGTGDPIDRWIDRRLAREELAPSPPADPATLLRRLATDLTGLPPTTAELDVFLADPSDAAYAAAVDALLASPRHGERMALFWLDLVRYADTVGYHGDQEHHVWPYRDWVVDAFNRNMPFDAFSEAQLAGDLVPGADQDDLVASTYNRLIQTSHEGGIQLEEYRAIYMGDRVRNVSAVWMGATLGCAQCHDHKYDPYTAADYYSFGAFFADIDEEDHLEDPYGGLNTSPTRRAPELSLYSPEARDEEAALLARVEAARAERDAVRAGLADARDAWRQDVLAGLAGSEAPDEVWVDDVVDTGGRLDGDWTFEEGGTPPPRSGTSVRRRTAEGLVQHYTVDTERTLAVEEGGVLYAWVLLDPEDPPEALMLQFHAADGWDHRAAWGGDEIPYGRREESWPGHRRMGALPATGEWVRLEVDTSAVGLGAADRIDGWAFTQHGGTVLWDRSGFLRGALGADLLAALRAEPATSAQEALLFEAQASRSRELARAEAAVAEAEAALRELRAALPRTLYTRRIDPPREVRILPRGNFLDASGPVVLPAVPAFLGALPAEPRQSRLDLARWLFRPLDEGGVGELTARVLVNRLWALLMGEGLCPSLEDFGGQGQPPVHPELLDMLALDLVESGWDVRAVLRRIVLTDAYRRSSVPDPATARRDPSNLLFARQSRWRLPAELVRDRLLFASGLLVDELGGPGVKPPQPAGLYRHLNFPKREYEADTDERRWRRGLYVHRQRQFLHPMLRAFDAPPGIACTAERTVSNTPLAALNLLNDPTAVEAARALARRALAQPATGERERLARTLRHVTGRRPSEAEVERLEALLVDGVAWWRERPEDAAAFTAGDADARVAAWTDVSRALLNLHEVVNRD